MQSHEVDYKISGDDLQFVTVELDPNETVIGEAGTMMYMDSDVSYEAKMGDGSNPSEGMMSKLFGAGKRLLTGESLFLTHFTNRGQGKKHVSFAGNYPGKIIPLNLANYKSPIIAQKGTFLCAAYGTKIDIAFSKKLGAGLFGGEGFILQKIIGDGMCFIHAGGCIIEKELNNETILVDTGCIVAFESDIDYDIQASGSLKTMVFGGEGIFLTRLTGTGKVWLQSLPVSRLAGKLLASIPQQKGEGSVLNGISKMFES